MPSEKTRALLRREITKEEVINDQIAYLLFDPTTLENERQSPFFYFIREEGGWKITTHLDSTFHQALEKAIETGDYKLPENF
jgi:membrane peptidoglycan carboxypeptidase